MSYSNAQPKPQPPPAPKPYWVTCEQRLVAANARIAELEACADCFISFDVAFQWSHGKPYCAACDEFAPADGGVETIEHRDDCKYVAACKLLGKELGVY